MDTRGVRIVSISGCGGWTLSLFLVVVVGGGWSHYSATFPVARTKRPLSSMTFSTVVSTGDGLRSWQNGWRFYWTPRKEKAMSMWAENPEWFDEWLEKQAMTGRFGEEIRKQVIEGEVLGYELWPKLLEDERYPGLAREAELAFIEQFVE
jgi:hypothetical protein